MNVQSVLRTLLLITCILNATSCGGGGGGGGDDFIGAAQVFIDVNPSTIDVGDRARVTTDISEVHQNGISLKFKYSSALTYVASSSFLKANGEEIDVSPYENQSDGNNIYLVFYFSPEDFGEDLEGKLTFELEAVDELENGKVEVDADVDDPDIDNRNEFNINSPEFAAEDGDFIEVVG